MRAVDAELLHARRLRRRLERILEVGSVAPTRLHELCEALAAVTDC